MYRRNSYDNNNDKLCMIHKKMHAVTYVISCVRYIYTQKYNYVVLRMRYNDDAMNTRIRKKFIKPSKYYLFVPRVCYYRICVVYYII